MSEENDLFNRPKALQCFGNETILNQVLSEYLSQVEPMLDRLRHARDKGDQVEVRKAVHWFRGGLSYLFSPAAERVCRKLDQETSQSPPVILVQTLADLESVMRRLRDHIKA